MVKKYKHDLNLIIDLFKKNNNWMNIKDVAAHLKINRNAAAKYLDILAYVGKLETKHEGPAKLYKASAEQPYALHLIDIQDKSALILIDENLKIIYMNEYFFSLFNIRKNDANMILHNNFIDVCKLETLRDFNDKFFFDTCIKMITAKNFSSVQKEFFISKRYFTAILPVLVRENNPGLLLSVRDINEFLKFFFTPLMQYFNTLNKPVIVINLDSSIVAFSDYSTKFFLEKFNIKLQLHLNLFEVLGSFSDTQLIKVGLESLNNNNGRVHLISSNLFVDISKIDILFLKQSYYLIEFSERELPNSSNRVDV